MYFYDENGNCYLKDQNGEMQYCGNYYDHAVNHAQAAMDVEEGQKRKKRHWAVRILLTAFLTLFLVVKYTLWGIFKVISVILGDFVPFFIMGLLAGLGISEALDD